ncbi:DUF4184 family protein, partial [Proteus columbae]|uniref:DUF4184 family protein n=1 Tax=Proteus columbae TaxID=1987580 RepID=UPI00200A9D1D
HETGTAVRYFSVLQAQLLQGMTNSQEIAIYKLLQHLGSILGLLIYVGNILNTSENKTIQYKKKTVLSYFA